MGDEIRNLEEVLLPKYLGDNRKILKCDTKRLTTPGENYGSLMLAIDLKIKNIGNEKEEELHIAAKAVPKNEFIQKMFQSPLTFEKELGFYKIVVPILRDFQKEEGLDDAMDFFPEFYGGRLGLGPNFDSFDDHAVILLENLKVSGFACADRTKGFDLETAKFILKDLSILHAIPLALKLKKPDAFRKTLPYLNSPQGFTILDENTINFMIEATVKIAEESQECVPLLQRMKDAMKGSIERARNPTPPREPFSTLVHSDLWVNNAMIKMENQKIVSNKIVDFQMTEYGSPARDLIFFIFDSIQNDVVVEYYDHLVEFYHRNFSNYLMKFNIDTASFSLDKFKEEINLTMKEQVLFQCFIMLKPIFATDSVIKELDTFNEMDFIKKVEISQAYKEKLWMIVKECAKRNWI